MTRFLFSSFLFLLCEFVNKYISLLSSLLFVLLLKTHGLVCSWACTILWFICCNNQENVKRVLPSEGLIPRRTHHDEGAEQHGLDPLGALMPGDEKHIQSLSLILRLLSRFSSTPCSPLQNTPRAPALLLSLSDNSPIQGQVE